MIGETLILPFAVVDCGNLTNPQEGIVSIGETTFQSEANYSCLEGHELDGNASRICLESGVWSDAEPVCNRKHCILSINI